MPTFLDLVSITASTKVLSLWNGSSNNPEPDGWYLPGFDDSSWPTSSVPTVVIASNLPDNVQAVAPWITPPDVKARMLFRQHVTIPARTQPYFIEEFSAVNQRQDLYVNGVAMLPNGYISILDPTFVTFTEDTVIAGHYGDTTFRWGTTDEGWLGFRLTMYAPDGGGQVYSWGTVTPAVNDKGVLGTGDTVTHLTPTPCDPALPTSIIKVVSNGKTTLYLSNNGVLYGSGDNSTGLLSTGTTDTSAHAVPAVISSGNVWPLADVSIGDDCAIVVASNGDVRMWGPNAHGSMGLGNTTSHPSSIFVANVGGRVLIGTDQDRYISAGRTFAVFANTFGVARSAGDNTYGQLGRGTSGGDVTTSGTVTGVGGIVQLAAGNDQALFVTSTDIVYAVGRAEYGSLGAPLYADGVGGAHIVTTAESTGLAASGVVQQAGPLTFFGNSSSVPFVLGDGTPYGGAGDGDGTQVYGTTGSPVGFVTSPLSNGVDGIAICSAGSNNPSTAGDSKAVFSAYGARVQVAHPDAVADSGPAQAFGSNADLTLWTIESVPETATQIAYQLTVTPGSVSDPTAFTSHVVLYDGGGGVLFDDVIGLSLSTTRNIGSSVDLSAAFWGTSVARIVATISTNTPHSAGGAITVRSTGSAEHLVTTSDGLLYTWGWGGAGQMGSGTDATTNLAPISVNGLGGVIGATVAEAVMFAISGTTDVQRRRGRAYAVVVS